MKIFFGRIENLRFRHQLIVLFGFALVTIIVTTSVGTAWFATRVATDNFNQQCLSLTSLLARQSRLAVLYGSAESAEEIAMAMFSFSHIKRVDIYDNNELIVNMGQSSKPSMYQVGGASNSLTPNLLYRGDKHWEFSAPVYIVEDNAEFDMSITGQSIQPEVIGSVVILFSTENLIALKNNIIIGNVIISIIFAFIIALFLMRYSRRVTIPLQNLSDTMESVQDMGTVNRVDVAGTYELRKMGKAFNQMMSTLDQQNNALIENNRELKNHIQKYELAKRVRAQLEKQLIQAHKMEAIGQLTGGIAHDFNNFLGSILGFAALALRMNRKPDQKEKIDEYLNEVVHAGNRAKSLVEQMLAFSRKSSVSAQVVNAAKAIEGAIKLLKSTLPSGISISVDCSDNVSNIKIDVVQLEQVVMNLFLNAKDAMKGEGSIIVRLGMHSTTGFVCSSCHEKVEGEFVQLSIKDSGSGIISNDLEHLFEPFYTTKEVGQGSGLGLSMVHGIVHGHFGHIRVDTELGVGTCFNLLFPPATEQPDEPIAEVTEEVIKNCYNKGARVLLVDDDISLAKCIGLLFEGEGYQVTVKNSAIDALSTYNNADIGYDIIVTDQAMPKMTGLELAKQVLAKDPEIPIILCTGFDRYANEELCKSIGIKGFLKKPFDHGKLLNIVNECLEKNDE